MVNRGYLNIIICSTPLPTIFDDQQWGEVANARREVRASLRERTDLTLKYNSSLRNFCKKNGITYLDFESDILDLNKGIVHSQFLNKNPLDHHLDSLEMFPILTSKLTQLGFR